MKKLKCRNFKFWSVIINLFTFSSYEKVFFVNGIFFKYLPFWINFRSYQKIPKNFHYQKFLELKRKHNYLGKQLFC